MNNNKIFEKIGKLTLSAILTSIVVTGVVFAATSWDRLRDGEVVSGTHWANMVAAINSKASLSNTYTKAEIDAKIANNKIFKKYGTFQGRANANHRVNKPICLTGYTPHIEVNIDWLEAVGTIDQGDIIGSWSVDGGSYWLINGGSYDSGRVLPSGEIIEGYGTPDDNYMNSKVSYNTYCMIN